MPPPGLVLTMGAAATVAVFAAGAWSGAAWTGQRHAAEERAAAAALAVRAETIRAAEAARIQQETAMDLALGRVIEDAKGVDAVRVVFDSGRVRRLFPAGD